MCLIHTRYRGWERSGILLTLCRTAFSLSLVLFFRRPNTYTHLAFSPLQPAAALTPSKRLKAGPERVGYTLTRTRGRGRRSENRQYLVLHLPFCPPHSRPILHLLKSLPFLFVLFSVFRWFHVYSLSLPSQAACDPWPGGILYSLSPLSAGKALTYMGQEWERWIHE